MSSPARRVLPALVALLASIVVALPGAAAATGGVATTGRVASLGDVLGDAVDAARSAGMAGLWSVARPLVRGLSTIDYGTDGRLTVLLLGSDFRPGYGGDRTDVMIVASIDPVTKLATMASIPRDTVFFPRHPDNGGGTSGTSRVNGMMFGYKSPQTSKPIKPAAIAKFTKDVAHALQVQIDYWAYIRFTGFTSLIDHVEGIPVDVTQAIRDPYFQWGPQPGIYIPKATGYQILGDFAPCNPKPHKCHSSLVYVRSRKGWVGTPPNTAPNSDYDRARRQQHLTLAAIRRVLARDAAQLESLRLASMTQVTTNMPRTAADAAALYDLFQGVTMTSSERVVFKGSTYVYSTPATPPYTYRLKLDVVRAWCDAHFAPVS